MVWLLYMAIEPSAVPLRSSSICSALRALTKAAAAFGRNSLPSPVSTILRPVRSKSLTPCRSSFSFAPEC